MTTTDPPSYLVPVRDSTGLVIKAFVGPADREDLPIDWAFDWLYIWDRSEFNCQTVVKMAVNGNLWGLMRYSLFPFPSAKPNFLLLEELEAHPARRPSESYAYKRLPPPPPSPYVSPIGKWLIWHACRTALDYCNLEQDPLLVLEAKADAVDYYSDTIKMTMVSQTVRAIGEDSHAFHFSRNQADAFCVRQRTQHGNPAQIPTP